MVNARGARGMSTTLSCLLRCSFRGKFQTGGEKTLIHGWARPTGLKFKFGGNPKSAPTGSMATLDVFLGT